MLNDTIKELKEVLEEQESSPDGESLTEVEDEDEFDLDCSLSPEDKEAFTASLRLLEMASAILKRGVLTLKKLTISDAEESFISWTSDLDREYLEIHDVIVEFGAALYPPFDVEELVPHLQQLEAAGLKCLVCMTAQPGITENDTHELTQGTNSFQKQVDVVKAALAEGALL